MPPTCRAGWSHPPGFISSRPLEEPKGRVAIVVSRPVVGSIRYRFEVGVASVPYSVPSRPNASPITAVDPVRVTSLVALPVAGLMRYSTAGTVEGLTVVVTPSMVPWLSKVRSMKNRGAPVGPMRVNAPVATFTRYRALKSWSRTHSNVTGSGLQSPTAYRVPRGLKARAMTASPRTRTPNRRARPVPWLMTASRWAPNRDPHMLYSVPPGDSASDPQSPPNVGPTSRVLTVAPRTVMAKISAPSGRPLP